MTRVSLNINGTPTSAEVEPRVHLGDFLRSQAGLTGTHLGCEHGVCGACTVLLDGKPVRSCITFAVACDGRDVTTIEGYAEDPVMARLRAAFSAHHALQCGYCTPGMLATARDIVLRLPDADEARVRVELSGNLCRCTGYVGIVGAIMSVLADLRQTPDKAVDALRPRLTGIAGAATVRPLVRSAPMSASPLFAPAPAPELSSAPAPASAQAQALALAQAELPSPAPASVAVDSPVVAPVPGAVSVPPTAQASASESIPEPVAPVSERIPAPPAPVSPPPAASGLAAGIEPAPSEHAGEPMTAIAAFKAGGSGVTATRPKAPAAPPAPKGTQIEASFEVLADVAPVWAFMVDLPAVASCLPGAVVEELDGDKVKGRIGIKFGPMNAAFAGSARLERDDATLSAVLRGAGQDSLSQSRATGDVHYRLESATPGATTVHVALIYTLQGPLAQFSRSGLVQDFVRRMIVDFGANVNARLQATQGDAPPPPPAQQQAINPVSIMFSVIWRRLMRLFGRG